MYVIIFIVGVCYYPEYASVYFIVAAFMCFIFYFVRKLENALKKSENGELENIIEEMPENDDENSNF